MPDPFDDLNLLERFDALFRGQAAYLLDELKNKASSTREDAELREALEILGVPAPSVSPQKYAPAFELLLRHRNPGFATPALADLEHRVLVALGTLASCDRTKQAVPDAVRKLFERIRSLCRTWRCPEAFSAVVWKLHVITL